MSGSAATDALASGVTVAFDGDDTLWHNETIFQDTTAWFRSLLATSGVDPDLVHDHLIATERRNLGYFGYGIKGFTLSLIETAIELTGGSVPNTTVTAIIDRGRDMLVHPTELIDGVPEVLDRLRHRVDRLLIVTKGDLLDQETKVARSGLAERFDEVHIVSEKDPQTYAAILAWHGVDPAHFVMIGNSLRSDVLPVVELGGAAIHIPYHVTWEIETVPAPESADYLTLSRLDEVPAALPGLLGL